MESRDLVVDRLPDQLGDVDDEVGLGLRRVGWAADLADAHADGVVEPPVLVGVAGVEDRADDLAAPRWIGATVAVPLEHHGRAVVGFDRGAEVGAERSAGSLATWEVRAAEAAADGALATALGEVEVLLPAA